MLVPLEGAAGPLPDLNFPGRWGFANRRCGPKDAGPRPGSGAPRKPVTEQASRPGLVSRERLIALQAAPARLRALVPPLRALAAASTRTRSRRNRER